MLEEELLQITNLLHLHFYKRIFAVVREREGSLTAMEVFAVDVIHALDKPTISEFADFLGISRSNATYKIHSLEQKGYVEKSPSEDDKREWRLTLTEKYYRYIHLYEDSFRAFIRENEKHFTTEQVERFGEILQKILGDAEEFADFEEFTSKSIDACSKPLSTPPAPGTEADQP